MSVAAVAAVAASATLRARLCPWLLALLLCPASLWAGTLYKAVGPDGRTYYTDRPPPGSKVERAINFADTPAAPGQPQGEAAVLFTTPTCGYCRQAKSWLSSRGIAYRESNIETDSGQRAYRQAGGSGGVPFLVWQGQRQMGFSADSYAALFRR